MDWLSVARLLVERGAPAAVVDRNLRLVLVNPAFERLVGVPREDIEGARLDDTGLGASLERVVLAAFERARGGGEYRIAGGRGLPIDVEVEALRLGEGPIAGVLLVVRSSHERLSSSTAAEVIEYAVGGTLITFGELRVMTTPSGIRRFWTHDAPRCHVALYGASDPCRECPVLLLERRGGDSGTFCAPRKQEGPERVATVERRGELVHVRIDRVVADIAGPVLDDLVARLVSGRSNR